MIFKLELSPQNFHYDVLYPLYSGAYQVTILKALYCLSRSSTVNCWINCLWLCDCYCYCLSQFLSFDLVFFEFLRRNSANYVQLAGINLDALEMNWSNFHPNYILHKPLKIAHNIFHNQDLIRSAPLWPSAYK